MGPLRKALGALREHGAKDGLALIAAEAKLRVADTNRVIVLLQVDLSVPKNRVRQRDASDDFQLLELDGAVTERTAAAIEAVDPARAASVRGRVRRGTAGFAAQWQGEPIGYVFWVAGTSDANAIVHPDLGWIPLRPRADEVYTFDYFVVPQWRGKGGVFCRHVQQAQHELGHLRSFGYVYLDNRAALWLYRTVGWTEAGRIIEHKLLLSKLAIVEDRLFVVRPFSRELIGRVPKRLLPKPR